MEKKRILMIDDDKLPMEYYIHALERNNFEVKYFVNPDKAFHYLESEEPHLEGIILDIMLPPGEKYKDKETRQGLITGVFLYDDLREKFSNTPIIILTNVRNPKTLDKFEEDRLLKIAFKPNCPPRLLTSLLEEMLNN